jgi:very-short-patch-repair endonuclease
LIDQILRKTHRSYPQADDTDFRSGPATANHSRMDPSSLIRLVAAGQHGVVTADQCRAAGLSPDQVKAAYRSRRWIRVCDGVYFVDGEAGEPPWSALVHGALLAGGPNAVAVLGTAARLHGIAGLGDTDVVDFSLPGRSTLTRCATGSRWRPRHLSLRADDVTYVDGFAVTTVLRTIADLVPRVDRLTAVSLLDSSLNRRLLAPDDLHVVRAMMAGRRGAARAGAWLWEADARAESPLETRIRLRAADGGVPPDELQYRIRNRAGQVVAIADFGWVAAGIVGEADGAQAHDNPKAIFRDRKRQNEIIAAGFTPLRFAWADTVNPAYVPRAIRAAMSARSDRSWPQVLDRGVSTPPTP